MLRRASAWAERYRFEGIGYLPLFEAFAVGGAFPRAGRLFIDLTHPAAAPGGRRFELDPAALVLRGPAPPGADPLQAALAPLGRPGSPFPGMGVRWAADAGGRVDGIPGRACEQGAAGECGGEEVLYLLRWETLPLHGDQPRPPPWPEPSPLRVVALGAGY